MGEMFDLLARANEATALASMRRGFGDDLGAEEASAEARYLLRTLSGLASALANKEAE